MEATVIPPEDLKVETISPHSKAASTSALRSAM